MRFELVSYPFYFDGAENSFSRLLCTEVDDLELSTRPAKCLKYDNIFYVGDLVQRTEAELFRMRNFGRKSLTEIKEALASLGLRLGMEAVDFRPSNHGEKPTASDAVVESVRADLLARSQTGVTKYGTTLERTDLNLRDWLQHAYEETLDQANYLKRAIMEIDNGPAART